MSLKAFIVTDDEYPEDVGGVLVFAETANQARSIGIRHLAVDYMGSCALRKPEYDEHAGGEAHVADTELHRKLGWRSENEEPGESCGLYANDLDKYAVCSKCCLCKECGHDEECTSKEQP